MTICSVCSTSRATCRGGEGGPDGLYFQDTRFLSGLELRLGGLAPLLLGSVVLDDNGALIVDLANADLHDADGRIWLQRDSLYLGRLKFLCGGACYERIRLRRFGPLAGTDSARDRVRRRLCRPVRGSRRAPAAARDDARRTARRAHASASPIPASTASSARTTLHFDPPPASLTPRSARWNLDFGEREHLHVVMRAACSIGDGAEPADLVPAYRAVRRMTRERAGGRAEITSSNDLFNAVIDRSAIGHRLLLTDTRPAFILMPASPGTAPSSAATASSPRSNCCGRRRKSPRAC